MGNACNVESAVSIERLQAAVLNNNPHEVQLCIEGGVNVNEAIDTKGFTVYDILDALDSGKSGGPPKAARDGTDMKIRSAQEKDRAEVRRLLQEAGATKRAVLLARKRQLGKGRQPSLDSSPSTPATMAPASPGAYSDTSPQQTMTIPGPASEVNGLQGSQSFVKVG
mmetsp:Transcript_7272/g.10467  ORF Transcript_7272/g.10467 Transcript_7272/m.10467 type:complete len:167 (+) Transcript_7272:194-694(+)